MLTGRFAEAISTFRKALAIDPDAPMVTPISPRPSSTKAGSLQPRRSPEKLSISTPRTLAPRICLD